MKIEIWRHGKWNACFVITFDNKYDSYSFASNGLFYPVKFVSPDEWIKEEL